MLLILQAIIKLGSEICWEVSFLGTICCVAFETSWFDITYKPTWPFHGHLISSAHWQPEKRGGTECIVINIYDTKAGVFSLNWIIKYRN